MASWDVLLQRTSEGYSAWCPGLPGGRARGETEEDAVANIAGAIEKYFAPVRAAGLSCLRGLRKGRAGLEVDIRPAGGLWTYEEFAKLPDEHNERWEVIAGELYRTHTSFPLHQTVLGDVLLAISQFADEEHDLGCTFPGPLDVLFAVGDFMAPDILFVRRDRLEIITRRAIEGGVPDLIVEIASDTT